MMIAPSLEVELARDHDAVMFLMPGALIVRALASGEAVRIAISDSQQQVLQALQSPSERHQENEKKYRCMGGHEEVRHALHAYTERHEIYQHYFLLNRDTRITARVRANDGSYFFALKKGSGENRGEFEFALDAHQFGPLDEFAKEYTRFSAITKERVIVPNGWEIDLFRSPLAGEIFAEFEYEKSAPGIAERLRLLPQELPQLVSGAWEDVTEDIRFSNASIAEQQSH